jgi:hypothetical protein
MFWMNLPVGCVVIIDATLIVPDDNCRFLNRNCCRFNNCSNLNSSNWLSMEEQVGLVSDQNLKQCRMHALGVSMSAFSDSVDTGLEPPAGLFAPLQALWWLKKGGLKLGTCWNKAHAICQLSEGTKAYDQVHALAHWIEGDEANANFWYYRTGEQRSPSIEAEWERLVALFHTL